MVMLYLEIFLFLFCLLFDFENVRVMFSTAFGLCQMLKFIDTFGCVLDLFFFYSSFSSWLNLTRVFSLSQFKSIHLICHHLSTLQLMQKHKHSCFFLLEFQVTILIHSEFCFASLLFSFDCIRNAILNKWFSCLNDSRFSWFTMKT